MALGFYALHKDFVDCGKTNYNRFFDLVMKKLNAQQPNSIKNNTVPSLPPLPSPSETTSQLFSKCSFEKQTFLTLFVNPQVQSAYGYSTLGSIQVTLTNNSSEFKYLLPITQFSRSSYKFATSLQLVAVNNMYENKYELLEQQLRMRVQKDYPNIKKWAREAEKRYKEQQQVKKNKQNKGSEDEEEEEDTTSNELPICELEQECLAELKDYANMQLEESPIDAKLLPMANEDYGLAVHQEKFTKQVKSSDCRKPVILKNGESYCEHIDITYYLNSAAMATVDANPTTSKTLLVKAYALWGKASLNAMTVKYHDADMGPRKRDPSNQKKETDIRPFEGGLIVSVAFTMQLP